METINEGRSFGSDNFSPVHPDIFSALLNANKGHAPAYGTDVYTAEAYAAFDTLFGRKVHTFFVFNGTGANASAISHLSHRYGSVLCAKMGHVNVDECGAVEHLSSCKIISFETPDGKLRPSMLIDVLEDVECQHRSQPEIVYISQCTEVGTVYKPEEVQELCEWAHFHGMKVIMDGARISNAAASLKCPITDYTVDAGVDVLVFGGTKNGLMFGEAVIFFDAMLAKNFEKTRKNCAQLCSKHRYLAIQFAALLKGDLWLRMGQKANERATYLAKSLQRVPGINIIRPVEANEIFIRLPNDMIDVLKKKYHMLSEEPGVHRLVCSFDTEESEIDEFVELALKTVEGSI